MAINENTENSRHTVPGPLRVLYRDEDVIVVDKPADLLVHRTAIDGDRDAVLQRLRDQIGQRVYPVHRLDRPTSGVLVMGLHSAAASWLAEHFRERAVAKLYLAIVRGWPPEAGVIERPLRPASGRPPQSAQTDYRRLATVQVPIPIGRWPTARYALLMASPRTGRRHQIRRHLNGLSHPVVGDVEHGDRHNNRLFREHYGCQRLLLHAWRLAFRRPGGEPLTVTAPPPDAFQAHAGRFGWSLDGDTLAAAGATLG